MTTRGTTKATSKVPKRTPRPRAPAGAVEVGERVCLRRPRPADEREFLELLKKSRAFLRPWEPRPPRGQSAHSAQRFQHFLRTASAARSERFLICRLDDGALLGSINLSEIVRGPFQSAFVGYWIGAPYQRRGYMGEALQLLLRHAFRTLKLHRVEANIIPTNAPSIALVRRAGFRREGLALRYLKIDGRWRDHEHWAILADEWRARGRTA